MLTPGQIEQLKILRASSGWNEVMKPYLIAEGSGLIRRLVEKNLPPDETAGLRADIKRIESIISWVDNQVNVADYNQRIDELDSHPGGGLPPSMAGANR